MSEPPNWRSQRRDAVLGAIRTWQGVHVRMAPHGRLQVTWDDFIRTDELEVIRNQRELIIEGLRIEAERAAEQRALEAITIDAPEPDPCIAPRACGVLGRCASSNMQRGCDRARDGP